MTAKRFTVEEMQNWNKRYKLSSDTLKVIDTYDGGEYWMIHGNEAYNLCIDMNALSDENGQLKSEILKQSKQCTASIQRFKEENEQLKNSLNFCKQNVKRLNDDKKNLLEENEQLKKELFETKKDYLIETSDEVDRVLYVHDEIEELRENIFEKGVYDD